MNRIIQVLGTSSDSGKTTLVMALCRYFSNRGYKVSPFKGVNMSLNSISIGDSSEISRAQWLQAIAARAKPDKHMNPFLLKPEGEGKSQLIVLGKSVGSLSIEKYYEYLNKNGYSIIRESLDFLLNKYDMVIAEGAGSAAEINMNGRDFSNIFVSSIYNTPAILVSDIDKGGVFASLYGTIKLMNRGDLVRYMVINKMRGNVEILDSGIKKLEGLTGKKVIGILPYLSDIKVPGEDSLNYTNEKISNNKIAVIKYPYMENYSDLDPFYLYNMGYKYITKDNVDDIDTAEVIVLPGSKMVFRDLEYVKKYGMDRKIIEKSETAKIIGICGGYQMLGKKIYDKNGIESNGEETECLGLLDLETIYNNEKKVDEVRYTMNENIFGENEESLGYEIHYGTIINNNEKNMNVVNNGEEGACKKNIMGTNIHGIFENMNFLKYIFNVKFPNYQEIMDGGIDDVTNSIMAHIDANLLNKLIEND